MAGLLTLEDLSRVQVRTRQPIESTYRGHRIVGMSLPSSGGFIVSALLNVLEREQSRAGGYRPDRFLHADKVIVSARISRSGSGRVKPGDLVGQSQVVAPWANDVRFVIDKEVR